MFLLFFVYVCFRFLFFLFLFCLSSFFFYFYAFIFFIKNHLNFAEKRLRRNWDFLAKVKWDFYVYWKSHFKFRPKKVTSKIAPLLLQCTFSEPTQCGEWESVREREKGTEIVNAHMYLHTLCLKCELCQAPAAGWAILSVRSQGRQGRTDGWRR